MRKFLVFITLLLNLSASAQKNQPLTDTLAKLVILDQRAAGLPPEGVSISAPEWLAFKDSAFKSNYKRAVNIFDNYGFPGYDLVGKEGSMNYWLLVQHADEWPAFQEKVLVAMKKQVDAKNASPSQFAYLTDRVKLNTGSKQIYGTQVTYNLDSCQAIPKPLEDPANVNARRKSVELDAIELYLNTMSESHFLMNKTMYEGKHIYAAKLYPVKPN